MTSYADMIADQETDLTFDDLQSWQGEQGAWQVDSGGVIFNNGTEYGQNTKATGSMTGLLAEPTYRLSQPQSASAGLIAQGAAQIQDKSVAASVDDSKRIMNEEFKAAANKPDQKPGTELTLLETLKKSLRTAMADPQIVGKAFGTAIAGSAAGVMAWLKQKDALKAEKARIGYEYDRIKQATDEKVSRASAVPSMQRMTKTTPNKRPADTFALPTPTWRPR